MKSNPIQSNPTLDLRLSNRAQVGSQLLIDAPQSYAGNTIVSSRHAPNPLEHLVFRNESQSRTRSHLQ